MMISKIVKCTCFTLSCIVASLVSFGQTYKTPAVGSEKGYGILFHINTDSAVTYCYADNGCCYAEHSGKLKRVNDTLFHAELIMNFGQFCMKNPKPEANAIYFKSDTFISEHLKDMELVLSGGAYTKLIDCYIEDNAKKSIPLPLKSGSYTIRFISKKNLLTGRALSFNAQYGTALDFTSGRSVTLDVVVKNDILYTVGPAEQVGYFMLRKSK